MHVVLAHDKDLILNDIRLVVNLVDDGCKGIDNVIAAKLAIVF